MEKLFSIVLAISLILTTVVAQESAPTVKGTLDITYNTRTNLDDKGKPNEGIRDVYMYDLVVVDTLLFQGAIRHQPTLFSSVLGRETQSALLNYDIALSVRNPKNISQVKAIGKLAGTAPIDKKGVYRFTDGTLRMAIDSAGQAAGFESQFRGLAEGKPPTNESTLARAKKQAVTLTKNIKGKKTKIVVSDYDIMKFNDLVLAAGPAKVYPEATINGEFMYDYERSAWYFHGITIVYTVDGKVMTDKLSGHIKWVEHPERETNGEGQYEFDVRVNEPEQATGEAAAFEASDDEAAFFETDSAIPALLGTAKYKDTMKGDSVASSKVAIDLTGHSLSKVQVVNLTKLIWLVSVVPMNAE